MKRLLLTMLLAACLPLVSGCAMCCGPFDYAYPTYGGKWERGDRFWGRVGSPLSGAGTAVVGDGEFIDQSMTGQSMTGQYMDSAPAHDGVIIESYPMENEYELVQPRR